MLDVFSAEIEQRGLRNETTFAMCEAYRSRNGEGEKPKPILRDVSDPRFHGRQPRF
jgi:hypothetical protein